MSLSREKKLYTHALRLLTTRDHSRFQLQNKLLRKATTESVHQVLDRLENNGFLNDQAFALSRAQQKRRGKLWGDLRIIKDLKGLGIDAKIIQSVLTEVENKKGQINSLKEVVQKWIEQSGPPTTISQLKKLYDHCFRLGYAGDLIKGQLDHYFENLEWVSNESQ